MLRVGFGGHCRDGGAVPDDARSTGALRPRARLLHTIGTELISSERVAVMELVKNAYDADADRVVVRLIGPLREGTGCLQVLDDGHGMTADTVRGTWLEVATPHRARQRRSERRGRRVLGEKGIGRFAAARLADHMLLVSRRAGEDVEVALELDWNDFRDPDKYLDEIRVGWWSRRPQAISTAGHAANIWSAAGEVPSDHGTLIELSQLTSTWTQQDAYDLRRDLSRLVSMRVPGTHQDFAIALVLEEAPAEWGELTGPVTSPAELERAPYKLIATVDSAGIADILVTVAEVEHAVKRDLGAAAPAWFPSGGSIPCGPFSMEVRVWDRDREAMTRQAGTDLTPREFGRLLDDASGVSVYRDGFRVLPFGEPGDDWLGLDKRRINNPSLRVSNNQVVGEVFITHEENPGLRDQTNREGLIEGPAYDALVGAVVDVINELEQRRFAFRRSQTKPDPEKQGTRLFEDLRITDLAAAVRERHGEDSELLALVARRESQIDENISKVKEVLARYTRLATLGRLVDDVIHQGQHAVGLIRNRIRTVDRALTQPSTQERDANLGVAVRSISTQADALATIFRRIAPFGGRRRGRPKELVLEEAIRESLSVLEHRAQKVGATITVEGPGSRVTIDPVEIQDVVVNLVDNALYWVAQAPKERRAVRVTVFKPQEGQVAITVSDTGPGVPEALRDLIFEPYFTTKPEGTGLGLAIVGELLQDYYDGDLALLDSELGGATFRATFRRRA
nr:ATP-binding protein [Geodermatophilus obscurus]